jgi:hypothetical protein
VGAGEGYGADWGGEAMSTTSDGSDMVGFDQSNPLSDTEIELLVAPDHTDGGLVIRDLPLRINATLSEVAVLRVDCRRLLAAASDTGLLRDRCRRAAQMLIQEIGAQGPETLTQTAQRAVDIICALREELKQNNREGDAP